MLRALVVLLLVVNVLVFGWRHGWIAGGAPPVSRLDQQTNPDTLKLLGQQAVTQLARLACVELGPLEGEEAARQGIAALGRAGLPSTAWEAQSTASRGQWAVATIKMPSKEFQARKEETYRSARIAFEPLPGFPDEQPTLVLSRHESQAAAEAAMEALNRRNYRGLRVLALQPARQQTLLRLARIDGLQLTKLDAIQNPPWGSARRSCEVTASPVTAASAASATAAAASR